MRILHLGKYYPPYQGGIESFMHALLPALALQSVESLALVHAHAPSGRMGQSGRTSEGPVSVWRVPCWGSLLYAPVSPAFPVWLERALVEFQPDVLHIHVPNTSGFWPLLSARARRLPWVVHWHADVLTAATRPALKHAYRGYRLFEAKLLDRASAIIATSPPYLAGSAPLKAVIDKCRVIPLGLDLGAQRAPSSVAADFAQVLWGARSTCSPKVLAIGRLAHYKGFQHLVTAAVHLPRARIIIVGEGEERASLQQLIARLGVADRVVLAGRLPDDQLTALLKSCDVFCLPSVEKTEAFGMVLLEAMACSRPLVASRLVDSGLVWVVQDGVTGLLATPGDHQDLSAKLSLAATMPQLGLAGRQRLESAFDIRQVAKSVAQMYHDVKSC